MIAARTRGRPWAAPIAVAVLASLHATAGCDPGVPGGKSEIEIVVRSGSGDAHPGIVWVELDPPGTPEHWAMDAGGHLPVSRTIWVDETGDRVVRAAGFRCPDSGCGSVDPEADVPTAAGRATVTLEPGRSSRVTVYLEGGECGNGVVERGEACDGAAGCTASCEMPISTLAEAPGSAGDGIAVVADGSGFSIAWIDGSCGGGSSSCLSWVSFDGDGDRSSTVESISIGETTGRLASDGRRFVSWVAAGGTAGEAGSVAALAPGDVSGPVDLGACSGALMPGTAVASAGDGGPLALALQPETGAIELRWPGGSTPAGFATGGSTVLDPSLAAVPEGDGLSIAALWAEGSAGGPAAAWHVRHWRTPGCTQHGPGCVPSPTETDAMPLELPAPGFHRLALSGGEGEAVQILVRSSGDDLEAIVFPFPEMPPEDPARCVVADGVLGGGTSASAMDLRDGTGVATLLVGPPDPEGACASSILLVPVDGSLPAMAASWDWTRSGCLGATAILVDGRIVAAWRGTGADPGTTTLSWTIAAAGDWR